MAFFRTVLCPRIPFWYASPPQCTLFYKNIRLKMQLENNRPVDRCNRFIRIIYQARQKNTFLIKKRMYKCTEKVNLTNINEIKCCILLTHIVSMKL